jgi:hypothetical protein
MVAVPVKKSQQQQEEATPVLTWDEYQQMRHQFEAIKEQEYQHFRKVIATLNPKPPEDIFDLLDRMMSMSEKLTKTSGSGSSSADVINMIFSFIKALSSLDRNALGEVFKKVGELLSAGKQQQAQQTS